MDRRGLTLAQQVDQWIFSDSDFARTPSIQNNMLPHEEAWKRAKGCRFIKELGKKLNLPKETTATARLFFQRFFMRNAFPKKENEDPHPFMIGGTAVHLACKLTDSYRRLNDIIYNCRLVANPEYAKNGARLAPTDKEAVNWKDNLFFYEGELCGAMSFDFGVKLPHKHAIELFHKHTSSTINHFEAMKHSDFIVYEQFSKALRKLRYACFKFCDEIMSTTLPLRYDAKRLGIIVLYAAVKTVQEWAKKEQDLSSTVKHFIENPFPMRDGRSIFDTDPFAEKEPAVFTKEAFESFAYEIFIFENRFKIEQYADFKYGKVAKAIKSSGLKGSAERVHFQHPLLQKQVLKQILQNLILQ
ncbi:hypothetical protein HDU67_008915 [Dinochytrium kinnereticum]|nr:hypothetical protein HDU67_008915 [Dinochytrium kinnereticum]